MRSKLQYFILSVICFLIFALGWYVGQKVQIPLSPLQTLPMDFVDGGDYILIEGSWAEKGLYDSSRPNISYIDCRKQECKMVIARVEDNYLQLSNEDFDVKNWGADEIIGVDSSPVCFTQRLVINKKSKNVKIIGIPKMPGDEGYIKDKICEKIFEKGSQVSNSVLVNGENATVHHLNWKNLFR